MERTRPLFGFTTTTLPFQFPSAARAAWRTAGSSPAGLSSAAGSPNELNRLPVSPRTRRRLRLWLADSVCWEGRFFATCGFEVEEVFPEEGATERVFDGCVLESCALPKQVPSPSRLKTAMARMASLLDKVEIKPPWFVSRWFRLPRRSWRLPTGRDFQIATSFPLRRLRFPAPPPHHAGPAG